MDFNSVERGFPFSLSSVSPLKKEAIRRGDISVLKGVIDEEIEKLTKKLVNEKNEFKFIQGQAYYAMALRDLLG